ncbi:helix-turn-helix transcriptional regulator [Nocardiopsis lucentensis]|uniref:helix-turn-helix transcriptional regulator n=1 Tax=Nocardiopsis lucentensis TaxID=53441 RepID=UPI00034D67D6|nr:helix-turn-helix transcriptional regulator [Nocardiopsis lucentensis]
MPDSPLGEYLRARRGQISPDTIGLVSHGRRRVPGLRREEVATMAGLSVDYYTRLEQGRERHPSVQVVEALCGALRLDGDARLHLFRVVGLVPNLGGGAVPERVAPELLRLMDLWSHTPAIVVGRAYDVLAGNRLGYALFAGFEYGPNLLEKVFLDPGARGFYPDWSRVAASAVAGFRVAHGRAPDDPRVCGVLRSLLERSPDFAALWERHEARGKRLESKRFHHPEVGELTLRMNAFDVRAAPGQELVVYHAEPGSASADALVLLGALAAVAEG